MSDKMGLAAALRLHAMKHTPLTKNRVVSKDNEKKEECLKKGMEVEKKEHYKDINSIVNDKDKSMAIIKAIAEYHLGEDEDYYEEED